MATLLDASLLAFLMPLFVFLFIFVVIYALLAKTNLFGKDQTALNFLAAICVSAVAVFAGNLVTLVGSVVPWIVFIVIILALIFGLYQMFGMKETEVWEVIGGPILYFVIILIVVAIGLSLAFKSEVSPYSGERTGESPVVVTTDPSQSPTVKNEVLTTLTHPRLLAALFMLLIASFSVRFLVPK